MRYTVVDTRWGVMHVVFGNAGLRETTVPQAGLDPADVARRRWPQATFEPDACPDLCDRLCRYFDGEVVSLAAKCDLTGLSSFSIRVLELCSRLEYGQLTTYGQMAARCDQPDASRAVGRALGANPIPIIIPCHRVVAVAGQPGGFSAPGGVSTKQRLLDMESGQADLFD
jgi:methylated-DNA-[protein]-cysteine S-methyltransferase